MSVLDGVQYCQATKGTNIYWDDWKDVPAGMHTFNAGVKFRVKPQWKAIVSSEEKGEQTFTDEADMWVELKNYTKDVKRFTVTYVDPPVFKFAERKIQVRNHLGRDIWTAWYDLFSFDNLVEAQDLQFRIRPDFVYSVSSGLGIGQANIIVDDADTLFKHLGRLVRETGVDSLVVKKVRYV